MTIPTPRPLDPDVLSERFGYHPPSTPEIAEYHQKIRTWCRHLAINLNAVVPESREKSLALTAVQEAMMWANAALAVHQRIEKPE